jgi:hypothetical protein
MDRMVERTLKNSPTQPVLTAATTGTRTFALLVLVPAIDSALVAVY